MLLNSASRSVLALMDLIQTAVGFAEGRIWYIAQGCSTYRASGPRMSVQMMFRRRSS
jgi:hypothetical protein